MLTKKKPSAGLNHTLPVQHKNVQFLIFLGNSQVEFNVKFATDDVTAPVAPQP